MPHEHKKATSPITLTDWVTTAGSIASIAAFVAIAPSHPFLTISAILTFAILICTKMNK